MHVDPGLEDRGDLDRATWLFCRECLTAHRLSDADERPIFTSDGTATPADDLRGYLRAHDGHPLGALARSSDRESRSHPRWDPMIRVTVEATDGETSYVIVSERPDVTSARRYTVRPGRLVAVEERAMLDETLLREAVDDALFPYAAPESLLDALLERVQVLVERTPIDDFDLVDEDRHDSTVELAGLPPAVVEPLRLALLELFPRAEAARIVGLLERELSCEIPVVRVRRRYVVGE